MPGYVTRRFVAISLALLVTSPDWAFSQGFPGGGRRGMGRRFREQMEQMQQQATPPVNNGQDKPKEEKKDEKPAEPRRTRAPGR